MSRWIAIGSILFSSWVWAQDELSLNHQAEFVERLKSAPVYQTVAQSVALDAADLKALTTAAVGQELDVPALSFGLSKQAGLAVRRVDLYAEGARVLVSDNSGVSKLPRSNRLFYVGSSRTGGVGFSLDPATGTVHGLLVDGKESFAIDSAVGKNGSDGLDLELRSLKETRDDSEFECGNDGLSQSPERVVDASNTYPSLNAMTKGGGLLYQAAIAIETDNEFLWDKFSNNTTNARDWIEDMFVAMNAFYEPDLQMRLLLGDVFLRVDTTPAGDPDFNQDPDGFNDSLNSFSGYWRDNQSGVNRVFSALLSGKDISSNSFSGVAWLNGYCSAYYGNSHNRIGKASFISPAFIAGGVGHEIGHNLGSQHTHCEALAAGGDFVDHCYANGGSGCYSGVTSCPAGMDGTLMSYCHAPSSGFDGGGPAVGPPSSCSNSDTFHPLIAGKLSGLLASNNPSCVADFQVSGMLFEDGFE